MKCSKKTDFCILVVYSILNASKIGKISKITSTK